MSARPNVWWRPRRADSPWVLGAGLFLAVVGVVVEKWDGPGWVLLGLSFLVAAGGVALEWRQRQALARDTRERMLDSASRALGETGDLRTVAETALDDFRVQPARVELAYVVRDRHQDLHDRLLKDSRPVLVVGHSMAGKTRMAYEVVRSLYAGWPVWIPERPDGLALLLPDGVPQRTVVWLDDLESYLTAAAVEAVVAYPA